MELESESEPLRRVAFGSCSRPEKDQAFWRSVGATQPQLWVWTGDIVYADTKRSLKSLLWPELFPYLYSPDEHKVAYAMQKNNMYYQEFATKTSIIGMWDDHDFGENNADGHFAHKEVSQKLLLDFLDEPPESARRSRHGVYTSYNVGPPGQRAKVVLLDVRYWRDLEGEGEALLGEEQWEWLARELSLGDCQLLLVFSGSQIVSGAHWAEEGWVLYPAERARLFQALSDARLPVLLFSGDVHYGQVSATYFCSPLSSGNFLVQPLFDTTASGLTHSLSNPLGSAALKPYEGWAKQVLDMLVPLSRHLQKPALAPLTEYDAAPEWNPNFGSIEIDWEAERVRVSIHALNQPADLQPQPLSYEFSQLKVFELSDTNLTTSDHMFPAHWSEGVHSARGSPGSKAMDLCRAEEVWKQQPPMPLCRNALWLSLFLSLVLLWCCFVCQLLGCCRRTRSNQGFNSKQPNEKKQKTT